MGKRMICKIFIVGDLSYGKVHAKLSFMNKQLQLRFVETGKADRIDFISLLCNGSFIYQNP